MTSPAGLMLIPVSPQTIYVPGRIMAADELGSSDEECHLIPKNARDAYKHSLQVWGTLSECGESASKIIETPYPLGWRRNLPFANSH